MGRIWEERQGWSWYSPSTQEIEQLMKQSLDVKFPRSNPVNPVHPVDVAAFLCASASLRLVTSSLSDLSPTGDL